MPAPPSGSFASAAAKPSRNSALRPPRPPPRTVTVVSPPDSSTAGSDTMSLPTRNWPVRNCSAIAACTAATSRASPSIRSLSTIGVTPRARAVSAAAPSACCGLAISWKRAWPKTGLSGFGVSSAAAARWASTASGSRISYLDRTARASAKVVGSGTVGPEAITAGSSPGTSEIASVITRAGAAAAASRPPLIAERCFRTVLISPIVAPERSNARVTACLSAKVRPGAGSARSAEPPPEIKQISWSSGPSPRAMSRIPRAASSPARSGTGWLASTISIWSQATL